MILNGPTRVFIHRHLGADVRHLALQGCKDPEVDFSLALEQITGWQKARNKIPSWAAIDGIVYPAPLSMEQCSSEITARYKAKIAGCGNLFVDLTAGFGVDAAFISKGFKQVVTVEQQQRLCMISSENFKCLGLNHINVICGDGVEYLHTLDHADLLLIDPARRDAHGARTYGIADCTPNVLEMRDELLIKAERTIIKLSPMLDWRKAVDDMGHVSVVHIVSVDNECKELLLEMRGDRQEVENDTLRIVCVNLLSNGDEKRFEFDASSAFSTHTFHTNLNPRYLYEPNASVMKAGCFDLVTERFRLWQLEKNSHLFVSDQEVRGFPGRGFFIERICSMNKRELKEALSGIEKANITVRNFPLSVAELRKRLKLKDGGEHYLFATSVANLGHRLFVCRKIS